jgi:hypothetical protein
MVDEVIRLYASHHQFYVQDSDPRGSSGDPTFWNEEAGRNRLAVGEGLLAIQTGSYDFVRVRVEQHESEPPLDLAEWDHVTECGLEVRTKFILVMGCLSRSGLFFEVRPGHYRVRVCHAYLAESELEIDDANLSAEYGDWYLVQFWPSADSGVSVLKRR